MRFLCTFAGGTDHLEPTLPVAAALHVRPAGWTPERSSGNLVLVTLGTVFAQESGDLFSRLLTAVRDLPVDVLVTVGPAVDPVERGSQPSHVRVVPLVEVLPRCAAVVSHGGSGTVVAALPGPQRAAVELERLPRPGRPG